MQKIYKQLLFTFFTCSTLPTIAQITTIKVAEKQDIPVKQAYDSLNNFVGKNANQLKGQELYLKGKSEGLRKFGYEGFFTDYTKSKSAKSNIYQCCEIFNSKYSELTGKYFVVLDVLIHPEATENKNLYGDTFYLKLQEKGSNDIVYYEYKSKFEHSFPFIVVGYFNKAKKTYSNQEIILRGRNWNDNTGQMHDIKTGNPVDISAGTVWKCVDVTIDEKYFNMVMLVENAKGEQLAYPIDGLNRSNYYAFRKREADIYRQKFGVETWNKILNGKLAIGMTEEMSKLSWGSPDKVNTTITAGSKTEQWVYKDNYLYFDNGKITAMQ